MRIYCITWGEFGVPHHAQYAAKVTPADHRRQHLGGTPLQGF
ncbi:hypothetical protein CAter282_0271 [Collimonas arenae]|uniref:Uncharacterized protein n=1 Tax=Collimonas arenae TaxID=279058 RepID=A0A127QEP5_9BURK|nr:hypothetical protein CAter282_0271 [Collimonas arenae]